MNKQLTIGILLGATALAGLFFLFGKDADTRISQNTEEPAVNVVDAPDPVTATTTPSESPTIAEDYISDEDDEPNEPVVQDDTWKTSAYTEPLPEKPSEQDAQYGFPDTNNNKVRDDIELLIVEEYGESEMMVETLFAQARTSEYRLAIARDGDISKNDVEETNSFVSKNSACRYFYYTNTLGTSDEYFAEASYELVSDGYDNTPEKKSLRQKANEAAHASIIRRVKMDHDQCQSYFAQTRDLDI